jgi:hypothetical protein
MIEFLFESGCNIAAQDNSGQTAAHYGKWIAIATLFFSSSCIAYYPLS